jgi:hypothetical protein
LPHEALFLPDVVEKSVADGGDDAATGQHLLFPRVLE